MIKEHIDMLRKLNFYIREQKIANKFASVNEKVKYYCMLLHEEVSELLREIPFKRHESMFAVNRQRLVEETSDIMIVLLDMMQELNIEKEVEEELSKKYQSLIKKNLGGTQ